MKKLLCQIKANWPFLLIVTSIFASGYLVRETLSAEISRQVTVVEKRMTTRVDTIQQDVRDIRNVLLGVYWSGPQGGAK
jgi:hypothetical protein